MASKTCPLCLRRHDALESCTLQVPFFSSWAYLTMKDRQEVHVCSCGTLLEAKMVRDFFWEIYGKVTVGYGPGLPPIPSLIPSPVHRVYRWTPYYASHAQVWARDVGWKDGWF